ncbi:MAG: hypothetical protein ACKV22_33935 [Bryobacteraceae bacterium]
MPSSTLSYGLAELTEKERFASQSTVLLRPEPVVRTIPITSRGMVVAFQYMEIGGPRPAWLVPVLQGFANLVSLTDNWDGEGASRIDRTTINRALAAIERLLASDGPAPSIVPLSDSGLQIEWHRNRRDLEIEFTPNGRVEFYYFDEETGEEHEGPVGPNFVNVEGYLERIR